MKGRNEKANGNGTKSCFGYVGKMYTAYIVSNIKRGAANGIKVSVLSTLLWGKKMHPILAHRSMKECTLGKNLHWHFNIEFTKQGFSIESFLKVLYPCVWIKIWKVYENASVFEINIICLVLAKRRQKRF